MFLDLAQAFDREWHEDLVYKMKKLLPHNVYKILESYLVGWKFRLRYKRFTAQDHIINCGILQGSLLRSILYLMFTLDMLTSNNICRISINILHPITAFKSDQGIADHLEDQNHQ